MDPRYETIKKWILIYFWLLIFEGALRKWILPQLATPLLLVRDPVVLLIYYKVYQKRIFPKGIWMELLLVLFIGSLAFTFISGHRNLEVALFGVRANFMHIPLIFIMGKCLEFSDVEKIMRYINYMIFPMTLLLVAQFLSPPSAWVNVGIGGVGTAGFSGALGKMRPPTVFSFITGTAMFYSLATVACISGFFLRKKIPRWLLILNILSIILAVPMSISRVLMFSVLIVVVAFGFGLLNSSRYRKYMGRVVFIFIFSAIICPYIPYIDQATTTFSSRWQSAANHSGGSATAATLGRTTNEFFGAIADIMHLPIFGLGLGIGTNAGSKLLTGEVLFLVSEGEWGRLLGEMGILGLVLMIFRTILSLSLAKRSWLMTSRGNLLAWLLCSNGFLLMVNGQWGQPTAQGFAILSCGLTLAALKKPVLGQS